MKTENESCSIVDACERIVPAWLVLLDNIPTAVLFLLGALMVGMAWWPLAIIMFLYNISAIVMFWGLICRHCPHFDTHACPCGYGAVAPKYFNKKEGGNFRKVFRKNIAIMYPCWLFPFAAGIYLLSTRFSNALLAVFIAFCVIGFVLIPLISRFVGCKGCNLRDECPWMKPSATTNTVS
jgi:hypothetical protein